MSMVTITHPFSSFSLWKSASLSPSGSLRVRHRLAPRRWLSHQPKSFFCSHRFDNSNVKCSIRNTDVHFKDVGTDEEVREDLPAVEANRSVPLINIKSDILDDESLRLLTEDAYADSLLTTLPILSEDEQNKLAATPVHPGGLYALYASCFAGNLVEQLWNIAWPSAIALLYPSLLPVAVVGFCAKITIIAGGPLVGRLMDHFPRVMAFSCLNIIQAVGQLISAAMIVYAHSLRLSSASSLLLCPWFIVLMLAGSFERLAGVALGVAMERDWVVLLAGVNRPIALAQANAILQRIDLLCEMAGASLFGILLSKYDPVTCVKITGGLMILSLPITLAFGWLTNKLSSGVLGRSKNLHTNYKTCNQEYQSDAGNIVHSGLEAIKLGWKEYLHQPVLPASLAYVLLYFNVVLGPGSLMTAFLTQRGLNPSIIGGFSGLCAFMGVAATFVSANLIRHFGLLKAGAVGLIYQASLLTVAVAIYLGESLSQQKTLLFFLSLIVLSRLGHMSYDIVGQQILQTGIPESKANIIGTTEVSVASVAECVMLGVAIVANDVSNYGFLAILSLMSVIGAAWLFCRWLFHPTDEQRTLFSFDPHPI